MKLGDAELDPLSPETLGSVLEARICFLILVLELAPATVWDLLRFYNVEDLPPDLKSLDRDWKVPINLFPSDGLNGGESIWNVPIIRLFELFASKKEEYSRLLGEAREKWVQVPHYSESVIAEDVFDGLVSDWHTLRADSTAADLCDSIAQWSSRWHLSDEWCLNFALGVLKAFKIKYIDQNIDANGEARKKSYIVVPQWLVDEWTERSWYDAVECIRDDRNKGIYAASSDIARAGTFRFAWRERIGGRIEDIFALEEVFVPFVKAEAKFVSDMELKFWRQFFINYRQRSDGLVGKLTDVITELQRFQNELQQYASKAKQVLKNKSRPVLEKTSGDAHFRWLVEFQLLGRSYQQIANDHGVTRISVMQAVKGLALFIGLTLRPSKRPGRPAGVKESHKRVVLGRSPRAPSK